FGTRLRLCMNLPTMAPQSTDMCQDTRFLKWMSWQRIGLKRAAQYTKASCGPHGTWSMATTEVPLRSARAASAERVHQVRWWGGALTRKFGMRVAADGTCGTPTITSPPGRAARTISANVAAGVFRCSRTWNAQTASY